MNWAEIEERWDWFAPQLQARWGRLTEADLTAARDGRDALLARVLDRYGIATDIAARHVDDWINSASIVAPVIPRPLQALSDAAASMHP